MIVTIAGIAMAGVTTIITKLRRNTKFETETEKRKGEPGGSPLSLFCCVASEAH
jgi:hypothetical protein